MNPRYTGGHFLVSNGRIFFIPLIEYSDLLGDFSAYICYVPLKFHFVVYSNTKHFQFSSSGNSSVFTVKLWFYFSRVLNNRLLRFIKSVNVLRLPCFQKLLSTLLGCFISVEMWLECSSQQFLDSSSGGIVEKLQFFTTATAFQNMLYFWAWNFKNIAETQQNETAFHRS